MFCESHLVTNMSRHSPQQAFQQGYSYLQGNGVTQDERRAVELLREAADAGHADGQLILAQCYDQVCMIQALTCALHTLTPPPH